VYSMHMYTYIYGVAIMIRLLKITVLFCKRALQKRLYSAKETYNFIDPTDRSHPIPLSHDALPPSQTSMFIYV